MRGAARTAQMSPASLTVILIPYASAASGRAASDVTQEQPTAQTSRTAIQNSSPGFTLSWNSDG